MTLVPRPGTGPAPGDWRSGRCDTIVVTAAMPMTTPSTVRPARSLFLASARRAMRIVRSPAVHADHSLGRMPVTSFWPSVRSPATTSV